jgi:hypothetical protein
MKNDADIPFQLPGLHVFSPRLAEFLKGEESSINGREMIASAAGLGDLNYEEFAFAMFKDQGKIPSDWQKHVLVFPYDNQRVLCLYWISNGWFLGFRNLNEDFDKLYRLVLIWHKI